jgi:predicted nucleotidyltransferase
MVEQKYIDYWRDRRVQESQYHKKLANEARQDVKQIVDFLVQHYAVQRIILFGSLTRDRFVADSDIDLAVEGLTSADYFKVLAQVNRLASRWIDLKLWQDLDPHFQSRVLETGEILYARE